MMSRLTTLSKVMTCLALLCIGANAAFNFGANAAFNYEIKTTPEARSKYEISGRLPGRYNVGGTYKKAKSLYTYWECENSITFGECQTCHKTGPSIDCAENGICRRCTDRVQEAKQNGFKCTNSECGKHGEATPFWSSYSRVSKYGISYKRECSECGKALNGQLPRDWRGRPYTEGYGTWVNKWSTSDKYIMWYDNRSGSRSKGRWVIGRECGSYEWKQMNSWQHVRFNGKMCVNCYQSDLVDFNKDADLTDMQQVYWRSYRDPARSNHGVCEFFETFERVAE